MPNLICQHCDKHFYNKHSGAKFCSRSCSGKENQKLGKIHTFDVSNSYKADYLIKRLQSLAQELGKTPSKREVSNPDQKVYRRTFGSWNRAIIESGLVPNRKTIFPDNYDRKIPLPLRFKTLRRDCFRCKYCGGTPKQGYILTVDHKIPISKGGKTIENNLTTACSLCNVGKSDSFI